MTRLRGHANAAAADRAAAIPVLGRVKRATVQRARAEGEYRAAILEAVDVLERDGISDRYAVVAEIAGVSKQAVRQLVERCRR